MTGRERSQPCRDKERDAVANLSAYERWMVSSNLRTIRETSVTAAEQAALLRANGYHRIAAAVEELSHAG